MDRIEDRIDGLCDHCGKKLTAGQRVYKPEQEESDQTANLQFDQVSRASDAPPVCCSIECALRVLGIPESTIRKMDPNLCYHCGMPFPTLNDCREIDGCRYCQDCADLLITFDGCSPFAIRSSSRADS